MPTSWTSSEVRPPAQPVATDCIEGWLCQPCTESTDREEPHMQYVIIHGRAPQSVMDDPSLREYVAKIIYGSPSRIYGVVLTNGNFVSLIVYDDDSVWAKGTFERMGSFAYGAVFAVDTDIAWREFGTWLGHYSGVLTPAVAV